MRRSQAHDSIHRTRRRGTGCPQAGLARRSAIARPDRRTVVGVLLRLRPRVTPPRTLITRACALTAGMDDRDLRRAGAARGPGCGCAAGCTSTATTGPRLDRYRGQPLLRVRAAQLVLRCTDYVFSHDSAAIAHGLGRSRPGPRAGPHHPTQGPRRRGPSRHQAPPRAVRRPPGDDRSTTCPSWIWHARPSTWPASTAWSRGWRAATQPQTGRHPGRPRTPPASPCGAGRGAGSWMPRSRWPIPVPSRGWSPRAACWSPA